MLHSSPATYHVLVVDGGEQLAMLVLEVIEDVRGLPQVGEVDQLGEGDIVRVYLRSGNWEHDVVRMEDKVGICERYGWSVGG